MNYDDKASQSNAAKVKARVAGGERLPLKTGSCLAGWHEGSKPRTRAGEPIKTCALYDSCPCKCHTDLDELFKLSERPRELVLNPEYKTRTTAQAFVRPTVATPGILSGETVAVGTSVSPYPGAIPGMKVKEFTDTASGRIQKGQLEYWVKQACDSWFIESLEAGPKISPCTPEWIAREIETAQGVAEPQLGGINHVFRRWEEIGIAEFGKSPARFEHYTTEAIEVGIDRMKEKHERSRKGALAF